MGRGRAYDIREYIVTLTQPTIITTQRARDYGSRDCQPILFIVIHATAGTNSLGWLKGNVNGTSIHVLISKNGTSYVMVDDNHAANHVGFSRYVDKGMVYEQHAKHNCNHISHGIELENLNNGRDPYPDVQLRAAAWWVQHWWGLHGTVPVLMHRDIDQHGKTDAAGIDVSNILRFIEDKPPPATGGTIDLGKITGDSAIIAAPRASAAQAVAYTMARRPQGYNEFDVKLIATYYWTHALLVGIDPLVAWAQMLHETGNLTSWWCQRPRRNPAGIGVTGTTSRNRTSPGAGWVRDQKTLLWKQGYAFTDWELSTKAHLGHLLVYAVGLHSLNDAQRAVVAFDPRSSAVPIAWHGAAPTLNGLNGRWAVPGTTYGASIAAIAEAIRGS